MKKKQSKKNKSKKKLIETKNAFQKIENNTLNNSKTNISKGIPKYVADRMARRIFFTAGIPTILGMSVFVISYIIVTKNIAEIPRIVWLPAVKNILRAILSATYFGMPLEILVLGLLIVLFSNF